MKYFNDKEHIGCQYYSKKIKNGFRYLEIKKGNVPKLRETKQHLLIWLIEGELSVAIDEIGQHVFQSGEMIYIPRNSESEVTVVEDCKVLFLLYEEPIYFCDKTFDQKFYKERHAINFEFKGLKINEPMDSFVRSVVCYLNDGLNCLLLHDIKQKELSLIFRTYYSKIDKANLFYHFLGKGIDFKKSVKSSFPLVKNVEELAVICGYEYKTFLRTFHEHFNMPPSQWMQEQTALQIESRLAKADIPIKTIAKEFNFSSAAHFTTYCKRLFGKTPVEVRKNLKEEDISI